MVEYKKPGVYIKEKNAFGNSVVEAETAIPVFIGLTEKALDNTVSLQNKPVKISSMRKDEQYFSDPQKHRFTVSISDSENANTIFVRNGGKILQAKLENNHCTIT